MKTLRAWRGVRLRTLETGCDPDAPSRRVAIPADWSEEAARGFVGLCCEDLQSGWNPVRLPDAAEGWIARVTSAETSRETAETLHCLLLLRQGCPDGGIWRGDGAADRGFVLNLAAFADSDTGFDWSCLASAADAAALVASRAGNGTIRIADLDGMLARLGLDYDSDAGRHAARESVRQLRQTLTNHCVRLVAGPAGHAEALLGVETAGFAPAFSMVDQGGRLTLAAQARLATMRLSPERALAMTLGGKAPLRPRDVAAHIAMHEALAPHLDACPPMPCRPLRLVSIADAPVRRALPARSKGFTQKVTIGGQRLFLRTGEYSDGSLGEVSITLAGRDGALTKGLAEAVATAISLALQHGVPLERFVDAFAHGRFGASGVVEGDPAILEASSPLDYVLRALAEAYLGRRIDDPPADESEGPPLLPLGLAGDTTGHHATAGGMRQRALRLVSLT